MPKIAAADATKSRMRSKSKRKPLRDVSNAKTAIKSSNVSKKISEDDGDDSLDRLLLVHSDLSFLIRQIDELVVQALQLKNNKGRKEINQFADVLSDMQTSLKPWVPRFQNALLSQPIGPENKPEQSMEGTVIRVPKESTNDVIDSPEQTKWESHVSPSPLVSWRAGCNTDGGRQLFILTPLPQRKAFSSKCPASALPAFEEIASDEIANPVSLSDSVGNLGNDLPEGVLAKPTSNRALDIEVNKGVGNHRTDCASPEKSSNMNYSLFVMTPCLKMSPPKSCILLEPISEFSRKKNKGVHKSTPFPTGVQTSIDSQDSESSSDQSSDDLKLKYPELYGIKIDNLQKRLVAEDSPNWIISPPKTCVILEPTDEGLLENLSGNCLPLKTNAACNQQNNFSSTRRKEFQDIISALDLAESTPMMKEPMSSFRNGKHPGENTLKKELWTKFEAASTHGICFKSSLQNTTKKGFLDILDEASDA